MVFEGLPKIVPVVPQLIRCKEVLHAICPVFFHRRQIEGLVTNNFIVEGILEDYSERANVL